MVGVWWQSCYLSSWKTYRTVKTIGNISQTTFLVKLGDREIYKCHITCRCGQQAAGTSRTCARSCFRVGKAVQGGAGLLLRELRNHAQVFTPSGWALHCKEARKTSKGDQRGWVLAGTTFRKGGRVFRAGIREAEQVTFTGTLIVKNSPSLQQKRPCQTALPLSSLLPWKKAL